MSIIINCVLVVEQDQSLYYPTNLESGVNSILSNVLVDQFLLFDELKNAISFENIKVVTKKYYEALNNGFPIVLFIQKNNIHMKVKIEFIPKSQMNIFIIPVEPLFQRKGLGSEKEQIDLAPYIMSAIQICKNFAIESLTTGE